MECAMETIHILSFRQQIERDRFTRKVQEGLRKRKEREIIDDATKPYTGNVNHRETVIRFDNLKSIQSQVQKQYKPNEIPVILNDTPMPVFIGKSETNRVKHTTLSTRTLYRDHNGTIRRRSADCSKWQGFDIKEKYAGINIYTIKEGAK
jgi:hypothetical protein